MDDQILARAAALLHHRKPDLHAGEALAPPIAQAATFHLPADGKAPFVYGRNGQPGWQAWIISCSDNAIFFIINDE